MSTSFDSAFTSVSLGEATFSYFRKTPVIKWSYDGFLDYMKPLILLEDNGDHSVWRNRYIISLKKIIGENKNDPASQLKQQIATLLLNQKQTASVAKLWKQLSGQTALQKKQQTFKINTQIDVLEVLEAARKQQTIQISRELHPKGSHHDTVATTEGHSEHDGADGYGVQFNFTGDETNYNNIDNVQSADSDVEDCFVEHVECQPVPIHQRSWILRSGTNVGDVLAEYVKTIPDSERHLCLAYWNILDLTEEKPRIKPFFPSDDDWNEITEGFETDVALVESNIPNAVQYFFYEVEKIIKIRDKNSIINAIERVDAELIEKNNSVKLSNEEKEAIVIIRRAIITYAENLIGSEPPLSEAAFDHAFPNMLTKRFLNKDELKMDVGEIACWVSAYRRNHGRSVVLPARIGQKCDFRGTLKDSVSKLEAIIGLRSGGLPEANRKKILEDRVDLAVAMRDVIYEFFNANCDAPEDDLHATYILGVQSWGWNHEIYGMDCKATNVLRFGRLSNTKMPNTLKTLTLLEKFYVIMSDVKATLAKICVHANSVALAHSRAYRLKRKRSGQDKQSGSFGVLPETPFKKGCRQHDNFQV